MSRLPEPSYEPARSEILAICKRIREQGFHDRDGFHPPWSERQYRQRGEPEAVLSVMAVGGWELAGELEKE